MVIHEIFMLFSLWVLPQVFQEPAVVTFEERKFSQSGLSAAEASLRHVAIIHFRNLGGKASVQESIVAEIPARELSSDLLPLLPPGPSDKFWKIEAVLGEEPIARVFVPKAVLNAHETVGPKWITPETFTGVIPLETPAEALRIWLDGTSTPLYSLAPDLRSFCAKVPEKDEWCARVRQMLPQIF